MSPSSNRARGLSGKIEYVRLLEQQQQRRFLRGWLNEREHFGKYEWFNFWIDQRLNCGINYGKYNWNDDRDTAIDR